MEERFCALEGGVRGMETFTAFAARASKGTSAAAAMRRTGEGIVAQKTGQRRGCHFEQEEVLYRPCGDGERSVMQVEGGVEHRGRKRVKRHWDGSPAAVPRPFVRGGG